MAEGKLNPREKARLEEKNKSRKTRTKYILMGVLVLLMAVLVIFVNSPLFSDGLAALKVNGKSYTVADVNYEYQRSYMQLTQAYGDSISIFLDTSKPLDEQTCILDSEGGTWDDYFKDLAEDNLLEQSVFYQAALDAGYTLTEDEQTEIDAAIDNYALYGSIYGYTTNGYLAANFGAGNNEKTVRRHMEREALVSRYLSDLYNSFSYTDEEIGNYYQEHAGAYNKVTMLYSYITLDTDENAETTVKSILDAMEDDSADAFKAAVQEITGSEATETTNTEEGFLSQFDGSVTKKDLRAGTTFTHSSESGCYAVYLEDFDDNHYETVSVRHILIRAEDSDGDGEYSDEEKQTAYDAVKAIEDEWLAGDATEDSFAQLATDRSEDSGSTEDGGLYTGIYKGQMVPEFDAFCFGEHEPGDYDIVYGESSSYAGYHLIYFVGADGEYYDQVLAEDGLREDAYTEQTNAMTEGITAQRTFMWRYVMNG